MTRSRHWGTPAGRHRALKDAFSPLDGLKAPFTPLNGLKASFSFSITAGYLGRKTGRGFRDDS